MAKGLNLETIVGAAFTVLDDVGIEGLTVRAVAARLDVKAPALYWHVRDKRTLLDEMATQVWREIGAAAGADRHRSWREACASYAHATRKGLLGHRDGARSFGGTSMTDASLLRDLEPHLAWMQDQGFSVEATTDAYAILTAFVIGHCIEEQERIQTTDDRYTIEARDARVDAEHHPLVAATGRRLAADPDQRFAALLDVVLTGIEGLRRPADQAGSPAAAGSAGARRRR